MKRSLCGGSCSITFRKACDRPKNLALPVDGSRLRTSIPEGEGMSQQQAELLQQDLTGSNSFNTTTSYSTGTVCQFSGTYIAKNRYMDIVGLYAKGEIF